MMAATAVRCSRELDGLAAHAASLRPPRVEATADMNDGAAGIGIEAAASGGGSGPPQRGGWGATSDMGP